MFFLVVAVAVLKRISSVACLWPKVTVSLLFHWLLMSLMSFFQGIAWIGKSYLSKKSWIKLVLKMLSYVQRSCRWLKNVLVSMRSVGLSCCVGFDCVNSWVSWVSRRRNCSFSSWRLLRSWKRRSRGRLGVLWKLSRLLILSVVLTSSLLSWFFLMSLQIFLNLSSSLRAKVFCRFPWVLFVLISQPLYQVLCFFSDFLFL